MFLRKGILKICSKFTGKHPYQSVISIKLLCKFIEITLRHGYSSINLLHIFRTPRPATLESSHFLNDFMLFHTQILCYFMPFWSEFYAILCHFGVNFKLFHTLGPIRR